MSERFKSFEQISEPDSRQKYFVIRPAGQEQYRKMTLRDVYDAVSDIRLSPSVPEDVRDKFTTAQHLCIYSWFSYPLNMPSSFWASVCVEMALRLRFHDEKSSLEKLVRRAVDASLLTADDGERCQAMRQLRNSVAHGSSMLHNHGISFLSFAAKVINNMYSDNVPPGEEK